MMAVVTGCAAGWIVCLATVALVAASPASGTTDSSEDDVVGCGGTILSASPITYSSIQVCAVNAASLCRICVYVYVRVSVCLVSA